MSGDPHGDPGHCPELVSVVVPAYNAEATIDETLLSIRRQTHRELEIIVVDDGSRDRTPAIVAAHAEEDPRVRLLSRANGGVAAARNAGIAEARGELVAPVDADDLWRPTKIERQLRLLRSGGPEVGVVYCWSAPIDPEGRVVGMGEMRKEAGDVLAALCRGNLVGNGSAALMRKSAVIEAGGFDPSLRERGAQGCEDWKLFLRIAERHLFLVVCDHLVGYRQVPDAMSVDVAQMLRSDALVRAEFLERRPEFARHLRRGRDSYVAWLLKREVEEGRWANCRLLLREQPKRKAAITAWPGLVGMAIGAKRRKRRERERGEPFLPPPVGAPRTDEPEQVAVAARESLDAQSV